jgi:hypothetical protein
VDHIAVYNTLDLSIDIDQFAPTLVEILNASKSPDSGFTFTSREEPRPSLLIQQALQFKIVQVFELAFARISDEFLKERIQARYNDTHAEVASVRAELENISLRTTCKQSDGLNF